MAGRRSRCRPQLVPTASPGAARYSGDGDELMGTAIDRLYAVVGDQHDVLDAGAVLSWYVEARLNGEGHPRHEWSCVAGHEVRLLVGLQTDPMPDAMDEVLAKTGVGEDLACYRVNLLRGHTWTDMIDRGLLRALQHLVTTGVLLVGFADHVGACLVRAIPVRGGSADVDHHWLARLDHPV